MSPRAWKYRKVEGGCTHSLQKSSGNVSPNTNGDHFDVYRCITTSPSECLQPTANILMLPPVYLFIPFCPFPLYLIEFCHSSPNTFHHPILCILLLCFSLYMLQICEVISIFLLLLTYFTLSKQKGSTFSCCCIVFISWKTLP